jgi:hypothetical protein
VTHPLCTFHPGDSQLKTEVLPNNAINPRRLDWENAGEAQNEQDKKLIFIIIILTQFGLNFSWLLKRRCQFLGTQLCPVNSMRRRVKWGINGASGI